ncbi:germin-like protein subfamily 1 member 1 [Cryptomeria japonica]|uniref:germin-like protein subfamily 1 member 1 n=1 Tax=Cryptomeria japonica TaxID=3369 RepID=UPI0027DA0AE2|nr:germin-like protein subfamily 1 member 1 [Cryptomeria japonica]
MVTNSELARKVEDREEKIRLLKENLERLESKLGDIETKAEEVYVQLEGVEGKGKEVAEIEKKPEPDPILKKEPLLKALKALMPTISADPDELQDFCVADTSSSTVFINGLPCINPSNASANHFTTSILNTPGNTSSSPFGASVIATTTDVLPGINTLGLIMARVDLAVEAVLPLHYHPRASELYFVLQGNLRVGFVDTSNKLFSSDIKTGDVFLFPKGLIHFVQNIGNDPVSVIAALDSQAPGTSIIPLATFASNPAIPNTVLAKTFQINDTEVDTIRKKLGGS